METKLELGQKVRRIGDSPVGEIIDETGGIFTVKYLSIQGDATLLVMGFYPAGDLELVEEEVRRSADAPLRD